MPLTNEVARVMVEMSIVREIERDIRERFENPQPRQRMVDTEVMGHKVTVDTETGDVFWKPEHGFVMAVGKSIDKGE